MRFLNRERELSLLQNEFKKSGFRMTVIYGRRRIGKSELIKEFIRDKRSVYYTATKNGIERNIEMFGRQVLASLSEESDYVSFSGIESLFLYLYEMGKKEKIVIVIDEIPYLAEADKGFLSLLQSYIDNYWIKTNIFFIICGSSISFMEDEVLSEKSPLFGRRTSQLRLEPFDYIDSGDFVPSYTLEEKAICYGLTGGVAKYLSLFDPEKSLDENIINNYFTRTGYMYDEPENLLTQEFRSVQTYNDLIFAMAKGSTKINEIADKSHIDSSTANHALKNLIATGVISKEDAMTDEGNRKKVRYIIRDGMFRFWYRFIPDAINAIELDQGRFYYEKIVKPKLHEYMGTIFEDMCRNYVLAGGLQGLLPLYITKAGKWWGSDKKTKEQTDIDIVGLDLQENKALIGECKFKSEPIDKDIYEKLKGKTGLIDRKYQTTLFCYFSLSGFSKWVVENAGANDMLLTLEDMYL